MKQRTQCDPWRTIAVLGAGNGGKAVAADLALQGVAVRLFEWPEYRPNVGALLEAPVIEAAGEVAGWAELQLVTTDLGEAVGGAGLTIAGEVQAYWLDPRKDAARGFGIPDA